MWRTAALYEAQRGKQTVWLKVAHSNPTCEDRLMHYLPGATPSAVRAAFPALTDREREVLTLLAQGVSNQELADRMGISLKTVRNHVSNILAKLQVTDRDEAVARARAAGLGMRKGGRL